MSSDRTPWPIAPLRRVAVLVDGENIRATHAGDIIAISKSLGEPSVQRVYGKPDSLGSWPGRPAWKAVHADEGPNSADILLSIEAIELALREDFGTFLIASRDGDFRHVARRLKELGCTVIGAGEAPASKRFADACTDFMLIGEDRVHLLVKACIDGEATKGDGVTLKILSDTMRFQNGVLASDLISSGKWRSWLGRFPDLYEIDSKGFGDARVRYRKEGFTSHFP